MPNAVFQIRDDDDTGIVYGVFNQEFFHYNFTAGQNPDGLQTAIDRILAGTDPAEVPHEKLTRFPLSELTEIRSYKGWTYIDVRHQGATQTGEVTIHFDTVDTADQARELAAVAGRPFREAETAAPVLSLFIFPGIAFLVFGFILSLVYLQAEAMEAGKGVRMRGRWALLEAIITSIAWVLGTNGALIAGGILVLLVFAWIVKNIVYWPRDLVFEFR